jgi:hypothetical protein
MNIVISSGHGKYVRGASGFLDEVDEARKVVNRVAELWQEAGVGVKVFHDDTSTSQNQNLNTIVNYHNSQARDRDVSVHFNAYQTTSGPMGVEVLYVTQQDLAGELSYAIAQAGGFTNRGPKYRSDLFFLNNTAKPAILIETCFCDSSADCDLYERNFEMICQQIAAVVGEVDIGAPPDIEQPPPVEPPPDTATARVDITIKTSGGPVVVSINGQDFMVQEPGPEQPSEPLIKPNHTNIICTVFGGGADPNDSAYPPYDAITDTELSVALPYKFPEPRPKVRVFNTENELSVLCEIRDVGPWMIDDADYVLGDARPIAEPAGSIIPSGKNQGRTSNGAGIDLTPGSANAIKLDGKGVVNWMFEQGDTLVA